MVALVETGNLVLVENGAMEQLKQATVSRADHLKRPIAAGTISVDAEVIVEARNSNDPERSMTAKLVRSTIENA